MSSESSEIIESFDFFSESRGKVIISRFIKQDSLDALYARREMLIHRLSKATTPVVISSLSSELKAVDKKILKLFGA